MDLIPERTTFCPVWCAIDLPTDSGGVVHVSDARVVSATGGGPAESGLTRVTVERFDAAAECTGVPAIRVEGPPEPMTPVQAFELAGVLQAAAITAMTCVETTAG